MTTRMLYERYGKFIKNRTRQDGRADVECSREEKTRMKDTTLSGMMDGELTEELSTVAQGFHRKQGEITMKEITDE
jgi:hypothetical protein